MSNEQVTVTQGRQLTKEYLAMNPLQKWETLALNGLLGTNEPWIDDMRQTLRGLQGTPPAQAREAMSEPDYMKLRDEWENILSDLDYSAEFVGNVCRSHKETILSALSLAADAGRYRETLTHISALCPVETGGMSSAALAGLLFNIEGHASQALGEA